MSKRCVIRVSLFNWPSLRLQDLSIHRPGSLRLATSPERMDELRSQASRAASYRYPTRVIDADEVVAKCPLINPDGILGALYTPHDGHIDPYSLTTALATEARRFGAKVHTHTEVTRLATNGRNRWSVETDRGRIECHHVVNAAGFWAQQVGRLVSSLPELPLVTAHHQYIITDSLKEIENAEFEIPVLRDLDASYYIRQVGALQQSADPLQLP